MTDQKPPQPSDAGDGEEQAGSSGYLPPNVSGSIYESSAYNQPTPEPWSEPPPQPPGEPMAEPMAEPSPPPTSGAGIEPPPPPPAGPPPPPYGGAPPPGYPYPPQPPQRNNTQLFGILGIVLAVVCCPLLGILFGWLSINEARKTGSDQTLGKVGFWLGIVITAIGVVGSIVAICAGGLSNWGNN